MNSRDDFPKGPENGDGRNLSTEEARQGETSGHMRLVLAVSLSCAFIALCLVYFIYF